jgi:glycosyltransferase involved in cell wall biosynthesis
MGIENKIMARPRLSICIPTFKREDLLRETLTHLREVCDENTEIVISENCSPDGTQDVIKSFAGQFRHFRAIRQTENRGAIMNFAAAISLARGQYLYPLCDDDRIHFQGLQNAISIMEQNPNIVGVFGGHEEWNRSSGKTYPNRKVEQRIDFDRGDKLGMFKKFVFLWNPVCRTDIVHRYGSFDKGSFGCWELIGSLLERGNVSVIPDLFYQHAQTEPRMEYELTEGWYHDAYRAGFESFAGRIGPFNEAELASFISNRVSHVYLQGLRFAEIKRDFLTGRRFALRARAYGLISESDVMSWEMKALVGMLAQRLLTRVELIPIIDEIVFDASPRLQSLREQFGAIAPKYSIIDISDEKSLQRSFRPSQFMVTYNYGVFESGAPVQCEPALSVAVEDLIETCRVTDQPLALNVTGAAATGGPIWHPQSASVSSSSVMSIPKLDTSSTATTTPSVIENKVGRNEPCPCRSGKKYKNCHGRRA